MDHRETFTNLLITLGVIVVVTIGAWVLRSSRKPPETIATQGTSTTGSAAQGKPTDHAEQKTFVTYTSPALVDAAKAEADTFRFRIGDAPEDFDLYYIDAIDSTDANPRRLGDQSRYFGKATQAQLLATGKEGRDYALQLLKNGGYHLLTRWEKNPATKHYYALLMVEYQQGHWTYLADLLVRDGYARVDGRTTPLPEDQRSEEAYMVELRQHSRYARDNKLGIWSRVKP